MGFGTGFTTEIYLNRQLFNSRYELDEKIEEIEGYIESTKKELTAMAVGTPKDIMSEKNEDGYIQSPLDQILRKTTELFEWLEENYSQLNKLYQYRQYLEENKALEMDSDHDI